MIAGEVHGAGPDVLLLHGVGLDRRVWCRVWPALARAHRVLLVDLPGHGRSAPVAPGTTLAELADGVATVVEGPTHVIGFSLGGLIAQELAITHPQLVSRLSLVSTVADRSDDQRRAVLERLRAATEDLPGSARASLERWFTPQWRVEEPELADRVLATLLANDPQSYLACYRVFATADADLWPRVGTVTAPTAVVTGQDDAGSTPQMARELAAAIPGARSAVVPGARHLLPLERPRQLLEALVPDEPAVTAVQHP